MSGLLLFFRDFNASPTSSTFNKLPSFIFDIFGAMFIEKISWRLLKSDLPSFKKIFNIPNNLMFCYNCAIIKFELLQYFFPGNFPKPLHYCIHDFTI